MNRNRHRCARAIALGTVVLALAARAETVPGLVPNQATQVVGYTASDGTLLVPVGIGDHNGDGFDDFAIGVSGADRSGAQSVGRIDVFLGSGATAPVLDASTLPSARGFRVTANTAQPFTLLGTRLAGIGDFNNDGRADFVADSNARAHVIFGRPGTPGNIDIAQLNGVNGLTLASENGDDAFPAAFARGAVDVNSDGYDDLVVSTLGAAAGGKVYVVFGLPSLFAFSPISNYATDPFGVTILGSSDVAIGRAMAGGPDVTGDGRDDLVIGAEFVNETDTAAAGRAYVLGGRAEGDFPDSVALDPRDPQVTHVLRGAFANDFFGRQVSIARDFDGDGTADIAVAANGHQFSSESFNGAVYVFRGGAALPDEASIAAAPDGVTRAAVTLPDPFDAMGFDTLPDRNGDARSELLVSASEFVPNVGQVGKVYGLDGRTLAAPTLPVTAIEAGTSPGFFLEGAAGAPGFRAAPVGRFTTASPAAFVLYRAGEVYLVHAQGRLFGDGFE